MVYENIQIEHGNFTIDRSGSSFFTMDHDENKLIEKNASGSVIFSYFLDTDIIEVQALKFDGYYFWSLERQGTAGFRIRKWEIDDDDLVRNVEEFSYTSDGVNSYNCYAFAVEYYSDSLFSTYSIGQTILGVVDGSVIRVGDKIIIGPSNAVGFEGQYQEVDVIGKTGNNITISPALSVPFNPGDAIYFTRNFYVFSDDATAGMDGALYKFRSFDGLLQTVNINNMFNTVRAAVFFKNQVMFVRSGEVIWLDPDSQNITKSQAIDNLDATRGVHLPASDLAGFSNTLYRLEQKHVFLSAGNYNTEDWSPQYNYNTSSVVAEVYFVAVKAEPPIVHRSASGVPLADTKSSIMVQVLDQFRTPVFNRLVSFASDGGSVSPTTATTDANGIARTTYTANTDYGQKTVTATVS
jgi:hypothetical protein